jgi:serine protease inhibitor
LGDRQVEQLWIALIEILKKTVLQRVIELLLIFALVSSASAQTTVVERTASAQTKFAVSMIRHLHASNKGNTIVSPAGTASAIAMLGVGANSIFRDTAQLALGYPNTRSADLDLEELLRLGASVVQADHERSFSTASAAVLDPQLDPEPNTVARMRDSGADVWIKSLGDASTIRSINEWVSTKTNGLIGEIVDSSISDSGMLVLNALYFKDKWATAFDEAQTQRSAFQNADGTVEMVPMMRTVVTAPARLEGRIAGVSLPYASSRFSLVLVTTSDQPADFLGFSNIEDWLDERAFQQTRIEVFLPRMVLRQTLDLMPSLQATAGLGSVFADKNTFSPISKKPVHLDAVLQKLYFKVDEQGSEAAAATGIFGRSITANRADTALIKFDRPFVFALRDRVTGMLLLSGYVGRIPLGNQ